MNNNQRIARNTFFLYFRMLLIIIVNLYASRITLKVLGVEDFGIYQIVGGVVTFLSFLSNALGSGTSRFITFEMGKDCPKLKELFSTVRIAHIILAILIVIIGEIVGLWAIYNKLVIPIDRIEAAVFAFHFSMIATFFQITQVPYNAIIIAYEKMNVYAYTSIFEAIGKLSIIYFLNLLMFDKLKIYSSLMCIITIAVMTIYRVYCRKNFEETKTKLIFNQNMFKNVASFSGWNLLSSSAASLANQGVTIVTNMFFSPAVVTVRSLALKINNILNQFVGSFRTAVNPQIVKKYAAGDYEGSRELALSSTKYTYYLMLIVVLPLFILCETVLKIWLDNVPNGLVLFTRLTLIQSLFQTLDASLYTPIYAKGRIKENAIICPIFDALQLPVVYILFKMGAPPIVLAWVELFACFILGIIVKPILVHLIVGYDYKEIIIMIGQCSFITFIASFIPIITSKLLNSNTVIGFFIIGFICIISLGATIWFIGLDKYMKNILIKYIKEKILKNRKE